MTDLANKIEDLIAEFGDDPKAALECISEYLSLRKHAMAQEPVACHCTMIQQDESCPIGYPSLLCEVCDGKGHIDVQPPLNALERLRAYATGNNGITFDTYDAAEVLGYLEMVAAQFQDRYTSPQPAAVQEPVAAEKLLARVASIICEETCGLTSECKSREAARALFYKGYLSSAAPLQHKRAQFLLEDCASYIDALHRKLSTKPLEIGIDTAILREVAAAIAAPPSEPAPQVVDDTITLTRSQMESVLKAAYPFSTADERKSTLAAAIASQEKKG